MKYIKKKEPPQSLEEYKATDGASFYDLHENHTNIKREVKNSLMAEQGYICCYCGRRINRGNSVIEHFKPKDPGKFPELELEYTNLLASCKGGATEREKKVRYQGKKFPLSCDNKKDNRIIEVSPTDPNCEEYFEYDEDGEIFGTNEQADWAIEILGLNNPYLKHERKQAIEPYVNLPDETDWEDEIARLSTPDKNGQYDPYCFAAIYYIKSYRLFFAVA